MIGSHRYENRNLINSLELYLALGRDKSKYYYWLNRFILRNSSLRNPRDYFLYRRTIKGSKGSSVQYYLSFTLAKAICIREGTIVSRSIREHIEDVIEWGIRYPNHTNPHAQPTLKLYSFQKKIVGRV